MTTSERTPRRLADRVPAKHRHIASVGLLLGLSAVVLGALALLPARTWMAQRSERAQVEAELVRVDGEVEQLEAMLELLETDAEVERRARESFDLVYPGEESYRILEKAEG